MNEKTATKLRKIATAQGLPYRPFKKYFKTLNWIDRTKVLQTKSHYNKVNTGE